MNLNIQERNIDMTIDKMIEVLTKMKEKVGGDEEVVVMATFGENDYFEPDYGVVEDMKDQDGYKFKCAFIAEAGGSELSKVGVPHYKWQPWASDNMFK